MTALTVRNENDDGVVRDSFARQGLLAHFGAQLTSVEPGSVQVEVPFRPELTR